MLLLIFLRLENLITKTATKLLLLADHLPTLHGCVDVQTEDVCELFATTRAGLEELPKVGGEVGGGGGEVATERGQGAQLLATLWTLGDSDGRWWRVHHVTWDICY